VLDRRSKLLYNIRKRFGGVHDMDLMFNERITQNLSASRDTDKRLHEIASAIIAVTGVDTRPPIIAGGSIRDMVFGINVNDYDIFMDVSDFDEDVQDDIVLLKAHALMKELGYSNCYVRNVTNKTEYNGAPGFECGFSVYEISPDWEVVDFQDIDLVQELEHFKPIQVVGRRDRNIQENIPKFLESFDYGLVRCAFDPESMEYIFHPTFHETLHSNEIRFDNDKTQRRLNRWRHKWVAYNYNFPFRLKNTGTASYTKAKDGKYTIKTNKIPVNWDDAFNRMFPNGPEVVREMQGFAAGDPIWMAGDLQRIRPLDDRPFGERLVELDRNF
jgi:hypothetical protein